MSFERPNHLLDILRKERIPVHKVRRGDVISDGFDGMLVAKVTHFDDGSLKIEDERNNGEIYPAHGRDWKVDIVARDCLVDDPFNPWK